MNDLIKALNIFQKYTGNIYSPTTCDHDILYVRCDPAIVSKEDKDTLEELGFFCASDMSVEDVGENFYSFRFGS
jgi:DNA-binding protein YbaB